MRPFLYSDTKNLLRYVHYVSFQMSSPKLRYAENCKWCDLHFSLNNILDELCDLSTFFAFSFFLSGDISTNFYPFGFIFARSVENISIYNLTELMASYDGKLHKLIFVFLCRNTLTDSSFSKNAFSRFSRTLDFASIKQNLVTSLMILLYYIIVKKQKLLKLLSILNLNWSLSG